MALRRSTTALSSVLPLRNPFICSSCLTRTQRRLETTPADTITSSATRSEPLPPTPSESVAPTTEPASSTTSKPIRAIPQPTPFVPDVSTFLTLIGRQLSTHASKFTSWEDMFTLNSQQLRSRGLDPPRTRKYFLRWREKFRRGDYGIGGDMQHVTDGVAQLRVCEVPSLPGKSNGYASTGHKPGFTKLILNVPLGQEGYVLGEGEGTEALRKPKGVTLREGRRIVGSWVMPVKGSGGSVATLKVREGMWEDRRGHKVHGGERRRAEVLHKARVAENRKNSR